jgi:hypothetical protein
VISLRALGIKCGLSIDFYTFLVSLICSAQAFFACFFDYTSNFFSSADLLNTEEVF